MQSSGSQPRSNSNNNLSSSNQVPRNSTAPEKLKFDSEFDFEQANAKFEQEIEKEFSEKLKLNGKGEVSQPAVPVTQTTTSEKSMPESGDGEPKTFYDKNLSFFDSISCEANEKNAKSKNWKEERKLNVETFGVNRNKQMMGRPATSNYYRGGQNRNYSSNYSSNYTSNYQGNYPGNNNNNRPQSNYYQQRQGGNNSGMRQGGYGRMSSSNSSSQMQQNQGRSRVPVDVGGYSDNRNSNSRYGSR